MRKRVWVINFFAGTPLSGWGERHFYFSKYWIKNGYDVTIISSSYNHMFNKNIEVEEGHKLENHDGVPFVWIKTPKYKATSPMRFYSMLLFAFRVWKFAKKSEDIPDTVIVSSMPIFPIWTGIRMKKKWGVKLIFEIRDIWPLTLQLLGNLSSKHPVVRFIGWFEKKGYQESDEIVSLLPNAYEHYKKVAGKDVSFNYIPNGIDGDLLKPEALPEALKNSIPKYKFIIGYAGTLGLANALEYFVGAAELLKEDHRFHFVIVGDGYLKQSLQERSSTWGNVSFFSKIKKNQVQSLLAHFDVCFVGRNGSELFKHGVSANKYFDYMLAAKPVLDSNNLIKDPIELSGGGIIVSPDSAESIRDGIYYLYQMSDEERYRMGKRGYDYVVKEHNIENLAKSYQSIF